MINSLSVLIVDDSHTMRLIVTEHLNKVATSLVLSQPPRIASIAFSYGTSVTTVRR